MTENTVQHCVDMAMVTRAEYDKWTSDSAILKKMLDNALYGGVVERAYEIAKLEFLVGG